MLSMFVGPATSAIDRYAASDEDWLTPAEPVVPRALLLYGMLTICRRRPERQIGALT